MKSGGTVFMGRCRVVLVVLYRTIHTVCQSWAQARSLVLQALSLEIKHKYYQNASALSRPLAKILFKQQFKHLKMLQAPQLKHIIILLKTELFCFRLLKAGFCDFYERITQQPNMMR